MGLFEQGRVNMVITNHVLRYSYHKSPTADGLVTYGETELPKGTLVDGKIENHSVFIEVLNKLVHEHKWKRKKLCFSVPDDTVVIRPVQIPASLTKEEAKDYIQLQIGTSIYLPFSQPALALDYLQSNAETQEVLLYAYPQEKIAAFEAAFEKAGLRPIIADLTSLAVYRYYYTKQTEKKDHVLLIYWNQGALVLTIFQQDKATFSRHIKIDPIGETEEILSSMNDSLLEINRIIDFYRYSMMKGEAEINQLVLTGDIRYLEEAENQLAGLAIPIERFQHEELAPKYMDVLGLAIKREA